MSFVAPPRWAHGDIPTATELNQYSTDLDYLHGWFGDAARNYAQLWSYENVSATFTGSDVYFVHRYRYLVYRGDGEIVDPSGTGDTVNVTGDGTNLVTYDLDSIDWMRPGKLYIAKDFVVCLEAKEP